MTKFSDYDIDDVISLVNYCFTKNQNFSKDALKMYLLEDLKRLLKNKSSGVRNNVCPSCLGSGYKE